MKRWEQFNQICHTNDSAEKQVEDMIIAKKEEGDYMPDEESLRKAMLDWMNEEVRTEGGK